MSRMKMAQLVAEAVAVLCPSCGESQPEKRTGSEMWTPEDFKAHQGVFKCVGCNKPILISHHTKVQFPL